LIAESRALANYPVGPKWSVSDISLNAFVFGHCTCTLIFPVQFSPPQGTSHFSNIRFGHKFYALWTNHCYPPQNEGAPPSYHIIRFVRHTYMYIPFGKHNCCNNYTNTNAWETKTKPQNPVGGGKFQGVGGFGGKAANRKQSSWGQ